jgi:hypothetical protein
MFTSLRQLLSGKDETESFVDELLRIDKGEGLLAKSGEPSSVHDSMRRPAE